MCPQTYILKIKYRIRLHSTACYRMFRDQRRPATLMTSGVFALPLRIIYATHSNHIKLKLIIIVVVVVVSETTANRASASTHKHFIARNSYMYIQKHAHTHTHKHNTVILRNVFLCGRARCRCIVVVLCTYRIQTTRAHNKRSQTTTTTLHVTFGVCTSLPRHSQFSSETVREACGRQRCVCVLVFFPPFCFVACVRSRRHSRKVSTHVWCERARVCCVDVRSFFVSSFDASDATPSGIPFASTLSKCIGGSVHTNTNTHSCMNTH